MKIGNHIIAPGQPIFIIGELCSNIIHYLPNDLDLVIGEAVKSNATALKVQLFTHKHFPEPEWESKKRVEFPRHLVPDFIRLCHKYDLLAGASVFDEEAVDLLEQHGADYIKIAVREFDNINLWQRVLESPLPKIASFDIGQNVDLPWARDTTWLACIPKYPNTSLRVPHYDKLTSWGWSSHYVRGDRCLDILLAVAAGAQIIERHFCLSENDYEAGWSSDPKEFRQMVQDVRRLEG